MGSNVFIAFLVAVSTTTWLYVRQLKVKTQDTKSSLILATVIFIIIFVVMFIIAGLINPGTSEV